MKLKYNRYFKIILLNKSINIYIYIYIIFYVSIKNINLISVYWLLNYIKYYLILILWYLIIIYFDGYFKTKYP